MIGAKVRQLRKERGWKPEELARRAQRHPDTIRKIERGDREPGSATLIALARAFGVPVDDLAPQEVQ